MKGTWVGYYREKSGTIYYVVEQHEQDLTSLVVRGSAYTLQGHLHARWTSNAIKLDSQTGPLIYSYGCEILSRNVSPQGIAVFDLARESASSAPTEIEGYSADLTDGERTPSKEKRIAETYLDKHVALEAARKYVATVKSGP